MKVSFNRLAEQELIAAALQFEAEAHLGAAFLDEYQAWEKQVRAFPVHVPKSLPAFAAVSCRVSSSTSPIRCVPIRSAFFTFVAHARLLWNTQIAPEPVGQGDHRVSLSRPLDG